MSSSNVESMIRSSKTPEVCSVQPSEQAVACRSSIPFGNGTLQPLSMDEQICLLSVVEALHNEMISSTQIFLIYNGARGIATKLGVDHDKATEFLNMLMKHFPNRFAGFM